MNIEISKGHNDDGCELIFGRRGSDELIYVKAESHCDAVKLKNLILREPPVIHWSDCSFNNSPAYESGECDCGAVKAHSRWYSYLYHLFCIRVVRYRNTLRWRIKKIFLKLSTNPTHGRG